MAMIVLIALTVAAYGQQVVILESYHFDLATAADSADFQKPHIFDVPDGVRADSLQLFIYPSATAVDLDITSRGGMPRPGYNYRTEDAYRWSSDSVALVTALAADDSLCMFSVGPCAKDTSLYNEHHGEKALFKAYQIRVKGGGTTNEDDIEYDIWMVGVKDED